MVFLHDGECGRNQTGKTYSSLFFSELWHMKMIIFPIACLSTDLVKIEERNGQGRAEQRYIKWTVCSNEADTEDAANNGLTV